MPRFAIEQGVRSDGSLKVRSVDNFSWSGCATKKRKRAEVKAASVNGHYSVDRAISHDHLDDLHRGMKMHQALFQEAHTFIRVCVCIMAGRHRLPGACFMEG